MYYYNCTDDINPVLGCTVVDWKIHQHSIPWSLPSLPPALPPLTQP